MNYENEQQPTNPNGEQAQPRPPRIYLASLTDHNDGVLHGCWLDADLEPDVLHEAIGEMLAESPTAERWCEPAEEWTIHDHEGFGNARIGEYESLDDVTELATGIQQHGDAYATWWSDVRDTQPDDAPDPTFDNRYQGEYSSSTGFGEQMLDDMGVSLDYFPGVPEWMWP